MAAGAYIDDQEIWKCSKHPSKRRRTGICPTCLRDRLSSLCPTCHNLRPCPCHLHTNTTSSSSDRVSNLIDSEPSFRRSKSLAIPLFRSKSRFSGKNDVVLDAEKPEKTSSFFSIFKKSKKLVEEENDNNITMIRSRSVSVFTSANSGDGKSPAAKGKGWHLPSPMKALRQSKTAKVVQEMSPLYRG